MGSLRLKKESKQTLDAINEDEEEEDGFDSSDGEPEEEVRP